MATSTTSPQLNRGGPTDPGRTPRRVGFSQTLGRWDVKLSPYLYISPPFFILFALTGLFPLLYTAFVSLHDWNLIGGKGEFVGFENYTYVLQQPNFWKGIRNTFSIFFISTIPPADPRDHDRRDARREPAGEDVLAHGCPAALRHRPPRGRQPHLRQALRRPVRHHQHAARQGGRRPPHRLARQVLPSHIAIASMVDFRWTGFNTLVFLAAMQAIPRDLYEAAVLDGANRVRQFFSVTVPMLRPPTIIFVVITSTIGGLQIFDEPPRLFDQVGQGGPSRQWMTATMYIYEVGWGGNQKSFGRASPSRGSCS